MSTPTIPTFDASAFNLDWQTFNVMVKQYSKELAKEWHKINYPAYYHAYQQYCELGMKGENGEKDSDLEKYLSSLSESDFHHLNQGIRMYDEKEFSHRYLLFEFQERLARQNTKEKEPCDSDCDSNCSNCEEDRKEDEAQLQMYKTGYMQKEVLIHL